MGGNLLHLEFNLEENDAIAMSKFGKEIIKLDFAKEVLRASDLK